ncbi:hypothetical protein [Hymenopteran arli-related virus OKIAV99]|uniref:Uncharacterized protein n=1 Tax=Hymenopteran arli-related virus OKIAV99 TaxID=2792566 RepID=A0AAE7P2J0_9MONO|nr:hypothetical protein QKT01_gp2 [Hymenopteran arli-related virus OKIAV99]QPL15342.1 hypothetical protein [Hymenopteran arli-related virus OKIAV99]
MITSVLVSIKDFFWSQVVGPQNSCPCCRFPRNIFYKAMSDVNYSQLIRAAFSAATPSGSATLTEEEIQRVHNHLVSKAKLGIAEARSLHPIELEFLYRYTPHSTVAEATSAKSKKSRTSEIEKLLTHMETVIEKDYPAVSMEVLGRVLDGYADQTSLKERIDNVARVRRAEIERRRMEETQVQLRVHAEGSLPAGPPLGVIDPLEVGMRTEIDETDPDPTEHPLTGAMTVDSSESEESREGQQSTSTPRPSVGLPPPNPPFSGLFDQDNTPPPFRPLGGTGTIPKYQPRGKPPSTSGAQQPTKATLRDDGTFSCVPSRYSEGIEWLGTRGYNLTDYERLMLALQYQIAGQVAQHDSRLTGLASQIEDLDKTQKRMCETLSGYVTGLNEMANKIVDLEKRVETCTHNVASLKQLVSLSSGKPSAPVPTPTPVYTTHPDAQLQGKAAARKTDLTGITSYLEYQCKYTPHLSKVHVEALTELFSMSNPVEIQNYSRQIGLPLTCPMIEYLATYDFF